MLSRYTPVTEERIQALFQEAIAHGDHDTARDCRLALQGDSDALEVITDILNEEEERQVNEDELDRIAAECEHSGKRVYVGTGRTGFYVCGCGATFFLNLDSKGRAVLKAHKVGSGS